MTKLYVIFTGLLIVWSNPKANEVLALLREENGYDFAGGMNVPPHRAAVEYRTNQGPQSSDFGGDVKFTLTSTQPFTISSPSNFLDFKKLMEKDEDSSEILPDCVVDNSPPGEKCVLLLAGRVKMTANGTLKPVQVWRGQSGQLMASSQLTSSVVGRVNLTGNPVSKPDFNIDKVANGSELDVSLIDSSQVTLTVNGVPAVLEKAQDVDLKRIGLPGAGTDTVYVVWISNLPIEDEEPSSMNVDDTHFSLLYDLLGNSRLRRWVPKVLLKHSGSGVDRQKFPPGSQCIAPILTAGQ